MHLRGLLAKRNGQHAVGMGAIRKLPCGLTDVTGPFLQAPMLPTQYAWPPTVNGDGVMTYERHGRSPLYATIFSSSIVPSPAVTDAHPTTGETTCTR